MKKFLQLFVAIMCVTSLLITACSSGNGSNKAGSDGGSGQNAAPIKLSLGTINTSDSVDGQAAVKFKELVEKNSNGKLQVDIFHNSQLGPTMTQIEGTMLGTQDMILAGMELYEKWAPDLKILSVFYVFDNDEHFNKFFQSSIFANIQKQLEENNIKWINQKFNWVTGPYRVLATTKPVEKLEDLQGMKLRMPEVETLQRSWKHLGAVPVTISWGETYLALKQNIVAGLEAPVSIIRPNKFPEVTKYITEVRTFPQRMGLAMNLQKLNSLPADLQTVLFNAADEAGEYYTSIVEKAAKDDLEAMKKEDNVQYFQPDLKPWKEKMKPFIYQLEQEGYLRKGLYDEIQALK